MSEQYRTPHLLTVAIVATAVLFCCGATCADAGGIGYNNSPQEPVSCVVDDECAAEEVCFRGSCEFNCVIDEDCPDGEVCRAELRSDVGDVVDVCRPGDDDDMDMECSSDEQCHELTGNALAECGIDGICFVPELDYALLIRDTTVVEADPMPDDGGVGADITAVYLRDSDGMPVAWADTLDLVPANDVAPSNPPVGKAEPLTTDGMCVDAAFDAAATPLGGEGGFLLVRFLEPTTERVVSTAPETWNIAVAEWGENCGATGEQDSIAVYGCAAPSHKSLDPAVHCDSQPLKSGSGFVAVQATGEK